MAHYRAQLVPELLSAGSMPIREFADAQGKRWLVWPTVPDSAGKLPTRLAAGWLTFECGRERRRLVPVPPEWETASDGDLCAWCATAEKVRRTSLA